MKLRLSVKVEYGCTCIKVPNSFKTLYVVMSTPMLGRSWIDALLEAQGYHESVLRMVSQEDSKIDKDLEAACDYIAELIRQESDRMTQELHNPSH